MGEYITIGQSLLITVFSMVVVFVVLLAISYLIDLLRIVTSDNRNEKVENIVMEKPKVIKGTKVEGKSNNEELVAVIAAAITANMGVEISDINIKSIKKTYPTSPIWAEAGRIDQALGRL